MAERPRPDAGPDGRLIVLGRVASTNDEAWRRGRALPRSAPPDGGPPRLQLGVLADAQTQGRGRNGRSWDSPPGGGLYLSLYLRPAWPPARAALLTLAAGLAAVESLAGFGLRPALKWPNDLWAPDGSGRKLGGLLVETRSEADRVAEAVIGAGINLRTPPGGWPVALRGRAAAFDELASQPAPAPRALAAALWARLEDELAGLASEGGTPGLVARARDASPLWGRRVAVEAPGRTLHGIAKDLAEDGGLVVRLDAGPDLVVHAGDVGVVWEGA